MRRSSTNIWKFSSNANLESASSFRSLANQFSLSLLKEQTCMYICINNINKWTWNILNVLLPWLAKTAVAVLTKKSQRVTVKARAQMTLRCRFMFKYNIIPAQAGMCWCEHHNISALHKELVHSWEGVYREYDSRMYVHMGMLMCVVCAWVCLHKFMWAHMCVCARFTGSCYIACACPREFL